MVSRRHRGFTLIELMAVIGVGAILSSTFFGIMYMQNVGYLHRLDEVDAHQNARAALNVMRRYLQGARWGLAQDAAAVGDVPVGQCYDSTDSTKSQGARNNLSSDDGADRMRIISIVADDNFVGSTTYGSGADCNTNAGPYDKGQVHVNVNPTATFTFPMLAAIGGTCTTGGSAANLVVQVVSDAGSGRSCAHRYNYTPYLSVSPCGDNGWNPGFSFGRVSMADFYIHSDAAGPSLRLRTNPTTTLIKDGSVVAFDIEDLQLRYGIDLSASPDRAVDAWCDDARPSSAGGDGSCNLKDSLGNTLTAQQIYNRIVAVQAVVRVRTEQTRPNTLANPLNPNLLTGKPVDNINEGFQRWLFSTTVNLRNNNLL